MRRIIAAAIAAATLFTAREATAAEGLFSNKIKGNGKKIIENRKSAMLFDEIVVEGPIYLTISDRRDGDILVRTDENIMPLVKMEVNDGTFRAKLTYGDAIEGDVRVEIEMPYNGRIDEISASAASKVRVCPRLVGEDIEIKATGASRIWADLHAKSVDVELGGASSAELTVEGEEVDISVWGASSINNLKVKALDCEIYATGASKIVGTLTTTECEGESAGASKITLAGKAEVCDFSITGASKLNATEFVTNNCKLSASGASAAHINCTGRLAATATGASKISYRGDCIVTSASDSVVKEQ